MTKTAFPIELDLEGLEVEAVKLHREGYSEIQVKSTMEGCTCH